MAASVLIVDDDDGIRRSMRLALEDQGYSVREAADGEAALLDAVRAPPEIVVLDLMLPGMDGFECCRRLRRSSDVPILMVSARGDSHDVVAGLEAGADDYIRKPFDVNELAARLRALRRRVRHGGSVADGAGSPGQDGTLQVGDVVVRSDRGEVEVAGRPVQLTRTEFRLLHELASWPGRVFSREMLLEKVWDYGYAGDVRLVDVHVRRLRAKVEDDAADPRRVVTVRGFGYKLEP